MTSKIHCEKCGEELDAISEYVEHLRTHGSNQPEPQSLTVTGFYRGFKRLIEKAVLLLLLFLGLLFSAVLFFEFRKDQPIVTPFDVPSDLKEFTGVSIAELLIDEINNRISSVPSQGYSGIVGADVGFGVQTARQEPVRFKRASPEVLTIKMEVGGISLDSFVSYVKGIFGKETEVISGNVITNGDNIKIIARTNKKGPWEEEGKEKDVEKVIERLADRMAFEMAPAYMKSSELARFYSNNRKYEEADMVYRKITKKSPNDEEAYVGWARVLLNMRQDGDAKEKYEMAYKISCASLNTPVNKNACAGVLVDWAIGLSIMSGDTAFKKNQEDAALYESYKQEAFKKYEEAAKTAPENPEVFSQWGYELALQAKNEKDRGNFEEAYIEYEDAISKFEGFKGKPDADFYNYWGNVLAMKGDYEMSIEKRREAVGIDPEYFLAYYSWGLDLFYLARIYDDMGGVDEATDRYSESISKYKQSLYVNPKFVDAYYRLGVSLGTLRLHEEAIKQFQKAIELDPRHPYAYNDLGYALEQLGKYSEAVERYKEAIRINPTYPAPYERWVNSLEAIAKEKTIDGEMRKELENAYNGWRWALREQCQRNQSVEKCDPDKIIKGIKEQRSQKVDFFKSSSDGKASKSLP